MTVSAGCFFFTIVFSCKAVSLTAARGGIVIRDITCYREWVWVISHESVVSRMVRRLAFVAHTFALTRLFYAHAFMFQTFNGQECGLAGVHSVFSASHCESDAKREVTVVLES